MAKITVSLDGTSLQELEITRINAKTSIGRRSSNTIILNNPAISGEHAVIEAHGSEFFLQDLNSTNGTQVNGQPVKRHFLQHGDVIEMGKYKIRFESEVTGGAMDRVGVDAGVVLVDYVDAPYPVIKVMNGSNAGKELVLKKVTTSLGSPGVQVVVITRNASAYYLSHVEGEQVPLINDQPLSSDPQQLHHDDVIDLSGTQLLFTAV